MDQIFRKAATLAAFGALFSAAAFAHAGVRDGGIERRDAINNERIEQGIRSGRITPHEAARLRRQQASIERLEAYARRDGVVTGRERARIEIAQNELGRNIRRETYDRQARR